MDISLFFLISLVSFSCFFINILVKGIYPRLIFNAICLVLFLVLGIYAPFTSIIQNGNVIIIGNNILGYVFYLFALISLLLGITNVFLAINIKEEV
ncbi:membrane-bound ClpP family serine protease [Methanococcus voltae]|uniref:Membrane-bound ClpP family serine protease n=1 Tax=Methanococcus voltae TaxID=2188 RepID=A0A8J7RFG7_METVO|nr:hypothetical protein [Methanococcus voltae]MBP2202217.1 membrane-bound ClpP family serine protease [Methanococcus voltae]